MILAVANPDRLTALDTSFLHLEDGGDAHMHVASVLVFEGEPPAPSNPLLGLRSVVVTPHVSAGTRDALRAKMRALFANVDRFFGGGELANRVDLG